jgi:hypothetical protein
MFDDFMTVMALWAQFNVGCGWRVIGAPLAAFEQSVGRWPFFAFNKEGTARL